jgi:hypothetical protein
VSNQFNELTLKWGTLKAWNFHTEKAIKLLTEYGELGSSMGAAQQRDTPRQKEIICELIDECDDPQGIYLDWDGEYVTKERAKEYVLQYGKKAATS